MGLISENNSYSQILTFTAEKAVLSCMFSSDNKTLAGLSADKMIRLWDIKSGKLVANFNDVTGDGDVAICFSPDGKSLASGSWDKSIKIWDVTKGKIVRRLIGHTQAVRCIRYSPDGKFIASAGWDYTIKLWFSATGVNLKNFSGHNQCVRALDFSPDGKYIASGGYDLNLKIWDVSSGNALLSVKGHKFPIEALVYHPSGKWVATAGLDNEIKIWDVNDGSLVKTFLGHKEGVYALAFSGDGTYLASAGNDLNTIIWAFNSGKKVKELTGHNNGVRSLSFSSDGMHLASGGIDNNVKVWDVSDLNIRPANIVTFTTESIDAINTEWLFPDIEDLMVFNKNQTITLSSDETGLNKLHLYQNKKELKQFNGKDTVSIIPKSIKKFQDKIEISYDVVLETRENEFQFYGENSEKQLYTISDAIILNLYNIEEQIKKSKLYLFVVSPALYNDKKFSYVPDDASMFTGILKTQETKCFSEVKITQLVKSEDASKEKILTEVLNVVNNCQKNDFAIISLSGIFLKNKDGTIFYLPPTTSIKTPEEQIIEMETLCKSFLKISGFSGIIVDASRKPKNVPEGYEIVTGKDIFQYMQNCMSFKKQYSLMTADNTTPVKLYDQLANSFHINNDNDENKAIDLQEVSVFIRNCTTSQFFLRGELFPLYSHIATQ